MPINTLDPTLTSSINEARTVLTITDATTYGGANPLRSALRVYIGIDKMNVQEVATPATVSSDTGDSATAASWTSEYTSVTDGWNRIKYVATEEYDIAETYDLYDAVNDEDGLVYRSKVDGNLGNSLTNVLYWELISDPSSLALNAGETNESLNIASLVWNRSFSWNAQYKFGLILSDNCECSDCDDSNIIQPYQLYKFLLDSLVFADQIAEPIKGEVIARKLQSIKVSGCGCN